MHDAKPDIQNDWEAFAYGSDAMATRGVNRSPACERVIRTVNRPVIRTTDKPAEAFKQE